MRNFVDILESRMLLSVAVNAAGWTQVTPSVDSRVVYVSSSQGNDNNSGLSPSSPVKTLAQGESLLRNGMPDELLLKAGDTFYDTFGVWGLSGRSAQEPMLIGSYGSGARPIVASGANGGINVFNGNGPVGNLDIIGIQFYANTRDPINGATDASVDKVGIAINTAGGSNFLIENCSVSYYYQNVVIQGTNSTNSYAYNVVFRRNQVFNAYSVDGAYAQGLFMSRVAGATIEESIFDHNGWNATVPGAQATIFNHNVYIQSNCSGITYTGNINARAASNDLEDRPGGQVTNNIFIDSPIPILIGGGSVAVPAGGITATVTGNIIIGSATIAGSPRGTAIMIANDLSTTGSTIVSNNLMIGDDESFGPAINIEYSNQYPDPTDAPGINNLTISNNIAYHWGSGVSIDNSLSFGGTGQYSINGLVLKNNQFVAPASGNFIKQGPAFLASEETWLNNSYISSRTPTAAFKIGNTSMSITNWLQTAEATASSQAPTFPDPTRTIAKYDAYLGGPNNIGAFLAKADTLSSQNWNANYTAAGPIAYLQAGFGVTQPAGIKINSSGSSSPTSAPAVQPQSSATSAPQSVSLSRQPTADVRLVLTLTATGSQKSTTFSLVFTPDNWNTSQSIPLAALLGWSSNTSYSVIGYAISADHAYDGIISGSQTFLSIAAL